MPARFCDRNGEPEREEEDWAFDMDNDGQNEFYVRFDELSADDFFDSRTRPWTACTRTKPISFEPSERWRDPSTGKGVDFTHERLNFIQVDSKNYVLLVKSATEFDREIRIMLIEKGEARKIGTVWVEKPEVSLWISRNGGEPTWRAP